MAGTCSFFKLGLQLNPLTHEDEPHPDEDSVTVNFENVKYKNTFLSKMYLSYHIYPYYPDSLNYQRDYLAYRDDSGKVNTYEAYLKDLKSVHSDAYFSC